MKIYWFLGIRILGQDGISEAQIRFDNQRTWNGNHRTHRTTHSITSAEHRLRWPDETNCRVPELHAGLGDTKRHAEANDWVVRVALQWAPSSVGENSFRGEKFVWWFQSKTCETLKLRLFQGIVHKICHTFFLENFEISRLFNKKFPITQISYVTDFMNGPQNS